MGVNASYYALRPPSIHRLREDPGRLHSLPESVPTTAVYHSYRAWSIVRNVLEPELEVEGLTVSSVLGAAVLGTEPFDLAHSAKYEDTDTVEGHHRFVSPSEVQTLASVLAAFDEDLIPSRYQSVRARDVYDKQSLGEVIEHIRGLKDFYAAAATLECSVVVHIA